jgi:hypothetical protein
VISGIKVWRGIGRDSAIGWRSGSSSRGVSGRRHVGEDQISCRGSRGSGGRGWWVRGTAGQRLRQRIVFLVGVLHLHGAVGARHGLVVGGRQVGVIGSSGGRPDNDGAGHLPSREARLLDGVGGLLSNAAGTLDLPHRHHTSSGTATLGGNSPLLNIPKLLLSPLYQWEKKCDRKVNTQLSLSV